MKVAGYAEAPVSKGARIHGHPGLATNRTMCGHMEQDMDVDCGALLEGEASIEEMVPWQLGAVM
jgi:altronate dehydratase